MISFALPRFCDQRLEHSRKRVHYPSGESWLAKLDTVVHELYHIDPQRTGIRQMVSDDGRLSQRCHSQAFFSCVAELVGMYLDTRPDPAIYDFLRDDFQTPRRPARCRRRHDFPQLPVVSADLSRAARRDARSGSCDPGSAFQRLHGAAAATVAALALHGSRSRPARVPHAAAPAASIATRPLATRRSELTTRERSGALRGSGPPSRVRSNSSIRTTPRELGAWMKRSGPSAMPTWVAPRPLVRKNTRSPAAGVCTSSPTSRLPFDRARQRDAVLAKTNATNPLQSNPDGSLPPLT